jgi:predicted HicB family RNase H-like nuclease
MQHARRSPKTDFLQIRVAPEDKRRMDDAAAAAHLDTSTWARQVLLQAVERAAFDPEPDNRG